MDYVDRVIKQLSVLGFTEDNIRIVLHDYDLSPRESSLVPWSEDSTYGAIKMFLVTKGTEGCTEKTIGYYRDTLNKFFGEVRMDPDDVTADTIRYYLAVRARRDGLSKVTQDNELRILRSFFRWCSAEGRIGKNPTLNIKAVRKEKKIKKAFSEMEMVQIRKAAQTLRDRAIVEVLYSTGCRVSELCGMDVADIDGDEIVVFGKGEKERTVYLNASAICAIKDYLASRKDSNDALFVSSHAPYGRLSKSGVENMIHRTGKLAGVGNCHPHRFRRTMATTALRRGMPLEQVQRLLGHERIATTTIYARSDEDSVKANHGKYVV